ncbi:lipopolysaccharide biosynthesis protein [Gryllotalpicola koreensis]|uniref:lipopolysaccharide biosynthesis protein n=1 Tax=Gryllotalpicola koreensis TaxID=993086 RepID=UPI0031E372BF
MVWTVAQKWVLRITGFVTIAILARLLSPADFGVVALASSLLPLLQLLADLGFSTYLLQVPEATTRRLSTFFWYSMASGVVLAGGLVLIAPLLGMLFATPAVTPVIQGLAPVALLITLGAVPTTLLRRNLRFRSLAVQATIAGAAGQAVAVVLALLGFGVWALVWQTLIVQIVSTALAWIASRWLPSFEFSRQEFGTMVRFGAKVIGIELVALARSWAENAIVVSALGVSGLGYLNIAQRLIQIAQDLTSAALVPVSLVVFAQIRSASDRLRAGYLRAQSVSYVVVGAIMLCLAVGSPVLIPMLFGSQWHESVAPAQLLAVAGILTIGASLDQGLFYGVGRPGTWFVYAIAVEILTVAVTAAVVHWGLGAMALGFVFVAAAATVARWPLVARELDARWWTVSMPIVKTSIPIAVAAVVGFAAVAITRPLPGPVSLLLAGLAMAAFYLPLLRLTARDTSAELIGLGQRALRRILPRAPKAAL